MVTTGHELENDAATPLEGTNAALALHAELDRLEHLVAAERSRADRATAELARHCAQVEVHAKKLEEEALTRASAESGRVRAAAEAARAATRERVDLMLAVTHDLRSPLSSILLSADIMRRAQPTADRRVDRKQIEMIAKAGERMRRLIDDLLTAAAIDGGELLLQVRPAEVAPLIEASVATMQPMAQARRMPLELDLPAGLPAILADGARFQQVLVNFLTNALEFSPEDGSVHIGASAQDREVLVVVRDEGSEVPVETLPHLFDRRAAASAKPGRTSLALFVARSIVEAHGGRSWATSSPDAGTSLHFTMPRA